MIDLAEIDLVVWKMQSLPERSAIRELFTKAYHACLFSGYLRGDCDDDANEYLRELWQATVRYARDSAS